MSEKISIVYHGRDNSYHVEMNGEEIYQHKDKREVDLFVAELKYRTEKLDPCTVAKQAKEDAMCDETSGLTDLDEER